MHEFDPTTPGQTPPTRPAPSAMSATSVGGSSGDTVRRPRARRLLSNRKRAWIMAAAVMCPVIGVSAGFASPASAATAQVPAGHSAGTPRSGSGGSNARSGPAAGGASGTVGKVSKSSFAVTTSAGQKVTVDETSSTKYEKKSRSTSARAITKGERVLVVGTTSGTTIKATQVIVQTTSGGSASSTSAAVIPFQPGAPTTSKQVGQIPASFSPGSGTIVSGTAANKATEAALAAYPGGVVDRVVKLSNGEYNVHIIGVNWPHHIFVSKSFKVVGAE